MISRYAYSEVKKALAREAAVALIGPRQVGKTTLALHIAQERTSIYLDLEAMADREKLSDPVQFLRQHGFLTTNPRFFRNNIDKYLNQCVKQQILQLFSHRNYSALKI